MDIYHTLAEYTSDITIYDPWASVSHVRQEYGIEVVNQLPVDHYDAVILAVAHDKFKDMDVAALLKENAVVYDVKGVLYRTIVDGRL